MLGRIIEAVFGREAGTACVDAQVRSTDLLDQHAERTLSRLTNKAVGAVVGVVGKLSLVTKRGDLANLAHSVGRDRQVLERLSTQRNLALGRKAGSCNIEFLQTLAVLADKNHLVDAHLVGRQSTSLVRADDAAAAQSLD